MQFSHTAQLFEADAQLVNQFPNPVISFNKELFVWYWNEGAELLFGYKRQEAIGKPLDVLLQLNHGQNLKNIIAELIEGREWRGESFLLDKNKSPVFCKLYLSKPKTENSHYLLLAKDITEKKQLEDRLLHKEEELKNFFECIDDGFFSFDKNWNYTHINKKAATLLNRLPSDLIGKNVWREFPELTKGIFYNAYHDAMKTQKATRLEEYSVLLNKWYEVDIYPSAESLSIFFKDVTEKKLAQKTIIEMAEQYHMIIEYAQEGICLIDDNDLVTFVNPYFSRMLGYDLEEMNRKDFFFFIHPEVRELERNMILRTGSKPERNELPLLMKDGQVKWCLVTVTSMQKGDQFTGSLVMVVDISERREKDIALATSRDELRQLASRLQTIREEERSSMARDIHDDLGQQLTALKMNIFAVAKLLHHAGELIKKQIEDILLMVNATIQSVERKSIELHPSLLHNVGLIAAMEWQNDEFQQRYGIEINFLVAGTDRNLDKQVAIALYRIYQESLTNIARHSHATLVTSRFIQNEKGCSLTIFDNGCGFDPDNQLKQKTLGLLSMKERSILIGGTCDISSEPGKGTLVSVFVAALNQP